jgi:hypothetical protein
MCANVDASLDSERMRSRDVLLEGLLRVSMTMDEADRVVAIRGSIVHTQLRGRSSDCIEGSDNKNRPFFRALPTVVEDSSPAASSGRVTLSAINISVEESPLGDDMDDLVERESAQSEGMHPLHSAASEDQRKDRLSLNSSQEGQQQVIGFSLSLFVCV